MPSESERIAAVVTVAWCDLLATETVSEEDDFFSLGGNSMLALQLAERVESQLDVEFPLDDLFVEGTYGAVLAAFRSTSASGETA